MRLSDWNYTSEGYYYITIRTSYKGNILGKIVDGIMLSNEIGVIADKYILEIPKHYPSVKIRAHIIMPDHVHILLEINKRLHQKPHHGVALQKHPDLDASRHGVKRQDSGDPVETGHGLSLQIKRPPKGSISIIVNQLKGSVKRYCNKHNIKFEWQKKFFDRIIRNEEEFENTKTYILNNPMDYWRKHHISQNTP